MSARGMTLALTGQALIRRDLRAHREPPVEALRGLLRGADVVFSNFEGSIGGRGWPTKESFVHTAPAEALLALRDFGVNLLALSNNHAFDLGPDGILATRAAAAQAGLASAGTGPDLASAAAPAYLDTPAGRVALVAVDCSGLPDFAYARDAGANLPARPGVNPLRLRRGVRLPAPLFEQLQALSEQLGHDLRKRERRRAGYPQMEEHGGCDFYGSWIEPGEVAAEIHRVDAADCERLLAAIAAAATQADAVIAYVHQHYWAPRWQDTPDWLRQVGRQCIDGGASAFVAHGVPMLLGIEFHAGRPLCYGLGNFVFHTQRPERYVAMPQTWESVVACCTLDQGRVELRLQPLELAGPDHGCPQLARGERAQAILAGMDTLCRPLGTAVDPRTGLASPLPAEAGTD